MTAEVSTSVEQKRPVIPLMMGQGEVAGLDVSNGVVMEKKSGRIGLPETIDKTEMAMMTRR